MRQQHGHDSGHKGAAGVTLLLYHEAIVLSPTTEIRGLPPVRVVAPGGFYYLPLYIH
jgi:hypothetical protein